MLPTSKFEEFRYFTIYFGKKKKRDTFVVGEQNIKSEVTVEKQTNVAFFVVGNEKLRPIYIGSITFCGTKFVVITNFN
jgi:hypothetical protein